MSAAADVAAAAVAELEAVRSRYKSTDVEKEVEPAYDLGNLTVFDGSSISFDDGDIEEQLRALHRDNAQLLVNAIFSLPTRREGHIVVATLPAPTTALPREKPLPKPKPETRWEKFAKTKGIQKRKRSRMVWDETKQEWLPRYGYKRANDDQNEWAIEVPSNADPYEDQFEKRAEEKKKRVEKNRASQQRNIEAAERQQRKALRSLPSAPIAAPTAALPQVAQQLASTAQSSAQAQANAIARQNRESLKRDLDVKLAVTRRSTASLGRFDKPLDIDKPLKTKQTRESAVGDTAKERKRALDLVERVAKPSTDVNARKAVNFMQQQDERKAKRQRR